MKDSQQYLLIESLTLRYIPLEMKGSLMSVTKNLSVKDNEANRSFEIKFNPFYHGLLVLIHFKHLQISDLQLYYRKKILKKKTTKKVNPQRKLRLYFNTTLELVTYFSSKSYTLDWFEISFNNGWSIHYNILGIHFITNNIKERNQLFEKLINISGQGPIDINTLEINETYVLMPNGKVKLKPLFS